jgi:thiol-disulfide isomerase/thioredoxin
VRFAWCLGLLGLCLGLSGCSLFGKKPAATPTVPGQPLPASTAGPVTPLAATQPPERSINTAGLSGILAGQVIDSYNRTPPPTFIQVSVPSEPGLGSPPPLEVAADAQGYFTIQGLQPGRHYQLIARAKTGDRILAGTTWATPPDPRLVIRVSEDFATPNTPPLPGAPALPGKQAVAVIQPPPQPGPSPGWPAPDRANQTWAPQGPPKEPAQAPQSGRAAELGRPEGVGGSALPPVPEPVGAGANPPNAGWTPHPDRIAGGDQAVASNQATPVIIPPQPQFQEQGNAPDGLLTSGPARVPSCVLTGQTLHNFALYDVSGKTFEYRRDHRGRLTLIDFWGTWCVHCWHAIPHLNIMQQRYGPAGLEVIGIAYEEGTPTEQVQKVDRVRTLRHINYRLLMGTDRNVDPVRTQFAVANWPTLVLLDDTGRIIWRAEGLDAQQLRELDIIIRQRLGVR